MDVVNFDNITCEHYCVFQSATVYIKQLFIMIFVYLNFFCLSDSNITVVATGVSTSNEVTMPPHIQILSADPNDQQQHHVQIQDSKYLKH